MSVNKNMLVLGLTGGMGAGKGYCAEIFARYGIMSIDTDKVSREVVKPGMPCLDELVGCFGESILMSNGELDRKTLAGIAFADVEKTAMLNSVTHKYILAECRKWLDSRREAGDFAAIVDAPLLFESRFNCICDYTIGVICDTETRIERVIERDGITREQALARIEKQHTNDFFRRCCDYLIYNERNLDPALQIDIIIQQLRFS